MMVGHSLLAAPVVDPGHIHRAVYLPFGAHWYDFWSGEVFEGGQTITRPAPWTRPVLFARESCAIPVNVAAQTFAARADRRSFMVFPPTGSGAFTTENFEDDDESEAYHYYFLGLCTGACSAGGQFRCQSDDRADGLGPGSICTVAVIPAERTTPSGTSSMWMRTGMRWARRTQVKIGLTVASPC